MHPPKMEPLIFATVNFDLELVVAVCEDEILNVGKRNGAGAVGNRRRAMSRLDRNVAFAEPIEIGDIVQGTTAIDRAVAEPLGKLERVVARTTRDRGFTRTDNEVVVARARAGIDGVVSGARPDRI